MNDTPSGRFPTFENVTFGVPVADNVSAEYSPILIDPVAEVVIVGATPATDFHSNSAHPPSDHHIEPLSVTVAYCARCVAGIAGSGTHVPSIFTSWVARSLPAPTHNDPPGPAAIVKEPAGIVSAVCAVHVPGHVPLTFLTLCTEFELRNATQMSPSGPAARTISRFDRARETGAATVHA